MRISYHIISYHIESSIAPQAHSVSHHVYIEDRAEAKDKKSKGLYISSNARVRKSQTENDVKHAE